MHLYQWHSQDFPKGVEEDNLKEKQGSLGAVAEGFFWWLFAACFSIIYQNTCNSMMEEEFDMVQPVNSSPHPQASSLFWTEAW